MLLLVSGQIKIIVLLFKAKCACVCFLVQADLNNTKLFIRLGVLRVYIPGRFRHSPVLGKINLHNTHGTK